MDRHVALRQALRHWAQGRNVQDCSRRERKGLSHLGFLAEGERNGRFNQGPFDA